MDFSKNILGGIYELEPEGLFGFDFYISLLFLFFLFYEPDCVLVQNGTSRDNFNIILFWSHHRNRCRSGLSLVRRENKKRR